MVFIGLIFGLWFGVNIVKRALEEPLRQIAANAGVEGSIVVNRVANEKGATGFNAATDTYEDLIKAGEEPDDRDPILYFKPDGTYDTAEKLDMPLALEGYEAPSDPRLKSFAVTPDPGVIEVNIHPAASWDELVENTQVLYEEAHLARLGTEKFMLDGRHTGTGGGNHVVLGGLTPEDSPFLRRPDVAGSLSLMS